MLCFGADLCWFFQQGRGLTRISMHFFPHVSLENVIFFFFNIWNCTWLTPMLTSLQSPLLAGFCFSLCFLSREVWNRLVCPHACAVCKQNTLIHYNNSLVFAERGRVGPGGDHTSMGCEVWPQLHEAPMGVKKMIIFYLATALQRSWVWAGARESPVGERDSSVFLTNMTVQWR